MSTTMKNGIQTRTTADGKKRHRGIIHTKNAGKRYGPWTASHAEARSWRTKALAESDRGPAAPTEPTTLREEWEAFIAGAKVGTVTDRSGKPYKPATLRGYERGWGRIEPELGAHRLTDIRRADVQAFVDRLVTAGHAASTVRNTLDPLRSMFRRAHARDRVLVNPTVNIDVPRVANGRERFATKEEAAALIAALPDGERALWATAIYGGLRRGELRALRWDDVDLAAGLIHVRRSWDDRDGEGTPKTTNAVRRVPIVPPLHVALEAHATKTNRDGSDLVFGRTAVDPFEPSTARARALKAWKAQDPPLNPITLHECRHTCASLLIASGANAKALSVVMGHATVEITFNRYGKLMPGGETEVGRLLGAFLAA
jgi:integrase